MSHITKINLIVKDLDAMDRATKRLGLELIRGQKTFISYTSGQCDHVLRVAGSPGAYEIGLIKRADGKGYDLGWDAHMSIHYPPTKALYDKVGYSQKETVQGANANKLLDWYAAEVARKQMSKQGFQVNMVQQDRRVQVLCRK
jgi:hypothetical protein